MERWGIWRRIRIIESGRKRKTAFVDGKRRRKEKERGSGH
jgi:hypothetical protein